MIQHHVTDDAVVGNDGLGTVEAAHNCVACLDVRHDAVTIIDCHQVTGTNRAVEQYDEPAHIIAGDFLQSQPQADAECTTEHRKRGDINAQ